jgi:hypothetical protein
VFNPNTGAHITSLVSPGINDGFATSVALAGDLAIIAAPGADTVYVYRNHGSGNWQAAGMLDSPGSGSEFGYSVAADGERIIVGAPGADRAYIYEDNGDNNWPAVAELTGSASSRLGASVAITGDVAFAAAPQLVYGSLRIGFVARYEKQDGSWPFVGYTLASPARDGDAYGMLISASATMLTAVERGSGGSVAAKYHIHTGPAQTWDTDTAKTWPIPIRPTSTRMVSVMPVIPMAITMACQTRPRPLRVPIRSIPIRTGMACWTARTPNRCRQTWITTALATLTSLPQALIP